MYSIKLNGYDITLTRFDLYGNRLVISHKYYNKDTKVVYDNIFNELINSNNLHIFEKIDKLLNIVLKNNIFTELYIDRKKNKILLTYE